MSAIKEAVSKAIAKELEDIKFPVGKESFRGKVIFDLDVELSRGNDILVRPTTSISPIKVMALLVKRSGVQAAAMKKLILEAAREAVENGTTFGEELEVTEKALKEVEEEILAKLPKVSRAAPTVVHGVVRLSKIVPKRVKPV